MVPLVRLIETTIRTVDEDFISKRTAMWNAGMTAGAVGTITEGLDRLNPTHLAFNTWRHVGSNAKWGIPGLASPKPEAIRPVRGSIGIGGALILPTGADSEMHELLAYLPDRAMEALKADGDFMQWVDRVVD